MKTANSSKTESAAGTIAAALPSYREGRGSSPRMYPSTARRRYEE